MTPRFFSIKRLSRCRVGEIFEISARINLSPPYQRQSEIWGTAKRQLFLDSLLNGFDIPKLYFHEVTQAKDKGFQYAVVDGKQRLETIWAFLNDKLELADDFEWYENSEIDLGSKKYSQLPPKVQARLDDIELPIQVIDTDDIQWVEELFCRLNEAVALNAPERRNAMGGPLPPIIRELPNHPFFADRLPFENNRYKHYDLATKFLFLEYRNRPIETKRKTLDEFVKDFSARNATAEANTLRAKVRVVLDRLADIFGKSDMLLSSLGLVVIYYLLERDKVLSRTTDCRDVLADFDELRRQVRSLMRSATTETGFKSTKLDTELVEFERLSQSPNDVTAMTTRMTTLRKFLGDPKQIKAKLRALK